MSDDENIFIYFKSIVVMAYDGMYIMSRSRSPLLLSIYLHQRCYSKAEAEPDVVAENDWDLLLRTSSNVL